MNAHTEGDWILHTPETQRKDRPITDNRILVVHPDGQRVIACCSTGFNNGKAEIPIEERIANAKLIAAAPKTRRDIDLLREDIKGLLLAVRSDACQRHPIVDLAINGFLTRHPELS